MPGRLIGFFKQLDQRLSAPYRKYPQITRDELKHPVVGLNVDLVGPAETVTMPPPLITDTLPQEMQTEFGDHHYPQPFLLTVQDAQLRGRHAVVMTAQDQLILESVLNRQDILDAASLGRIHYPTSPGEFFKQATQTRQYDRVCSLVTPWSRGYYHWMLENLLRLHLLEQWQAEQHEKALILIDPDPPRWQRETMQLLGYTDGDYAEWDVTAARAKTALVPMLPYNTGVPSPALARAVSNKLKANLPAETPTFNAPYIYISRRQAKRRRVINEADVMQVLHDYGFQPFELEDYSVAEQIQLFAQAKVIIGPHGAGFANLIHSQDATLIEIFEPGYINACFFRLASGLGLRYGCIVGEGHGEDSRVNTGRLVEVVQKAL